MVSALHLLFTRWPSPPETPLSTLHLHDLASGDAPESAFNRHTVVSALRGCLVSVGILGSCSGCSLRRGATTTARMAGVADRGIRLLGRWRSGAYSALSRSTPNTSTMYHAASNFTPPRPNHILPSSSWATTRPLETTAPLGPTVAIWGVWEERIGGDCHW